MRQAHLRLSNAAGTMLAGPREQMRLAAARLNDLSPLTVLARGYAIARTGEGAVVRSVDAVLPGENVDVTVSDGVLSCRVETTKRKDAL